MKFAPADIARFDSGTFARGEAYARQGKVLDLSWKDSFLQAGLNGSGGGSYSLAVRVTKGCDGVTFDGSCSCPIGYNCKHAVAALLASLDLAPAAAG